MKKFSFELEDLLSLKKFQQEQSQIELGKAVAEENRIQDGLKSLAQAHNSTKQIMSGNVDFFEINRAQQYYSFLKIQEEHLLEELSLAKIETEKRREIFKAALQKTESLKKLREQKLESYRALENQEEEDFADDISNAKYNKN